MLFNAAYGPWTSNNLCLGGLAAGTTYKFKVASVNSVGSSQLTLEFPIYVGYLPDPPTGLIILFDFTDSTQVSFMWTAPVNNGGPVVTGY